MNEPHILRTGVGTKRTWGAARRWSGVARRVKLGVPGKVYQTYFVVSLG